mmetsp:Transcript_94349/g.177577  ORF Transcript_94349/g.177577 Transcript_94349/m.177577 type:complete len:1103 (-) Transcript_94349:191-3499(-)
MRAARAAKDINSSTDGLEKHLEDVVSLESNGSSLDYILQTLLPLLKIVFSELCAAKPENPSAFLAVWLLEQCGCPVSIIADLRSWISTAENVANPSKENGIAEVMVKRPSIPPNPEKESPKKTALKKDVNGKPPSPNGETSKAPKDDSSPKSGFKKPRTAGFAGDVKEDDKDGEEEEKKEEEPGRRRLSFWSKTEEEEAASEKSDDDEDDLNDADKDDALERLRGANPEGQGGDHSHRTSCMAGKFGDRRRRFTVAITSTDIPKPPRELMNQLLRNVPLFKELPQNDINAIIGIIRCRKFEADENVINFGGASEDLHIVVEGVGKVAVPQQMGMVRHGDFFGEQSLRLVGATNSTQVVAQGGPVTTISINSQDFKDLPLSTKHYVDRNGHSSDKVARNVRGDMDHIDRQHKVKEGGLCEASGLPIVEKYVKSDEDREIIITALKNNRVLGEVLTLSEDQLHLLSDAMHLVCLPAHETLYKKGDRGTALFIVQEGLLSVTLDDAMAGEFKIRVGDSFGELSLLYDAPRPATMTALRECKLFVLPRYEFRLVIRMSHSQRVVQYAELIMKVPCLQGMVDETNADLMAGALEEISFLEHEEVCVEGEDAGLLFIVWEGECDVLEGEKVVRKLKKGEWIGEEQLIKHIKATETVIVATESATILALDTHSLHTVVKASGEVKKVNQKEGEKQLTPSAARASCSSRTSLCAMPFLDHTDKQKVADDYLQRRLSRAGHRRDMKKQESLDPKDKAHDLKHDFDDLEQVGPLGEGSFGTVYLLVDKASRRPYALKGLCKKHITREMLEHIVKNERSTMILLDSDFIVRLHKTYQDSNYIYLLLEAALGGEVFDIYTNYDLFGKISHAKFYIACVTMALQHMHLKRVIYRDLKLENCLLDCRGYLKLTDLGIAKVVIGKTYTVCGTADYFAPETLKQVGHNRAVDWWACGVLLFIMCAGRSPFDAPEVQTIYKNIIKGFSKVKFPKSFPSDLIDCIKSLCRKKPEERVTMQKGGVDNFKEMPFFSSFSWDNLAKHEMEPPFQPPATDYDRIRTKKVSNDFVVQFDELQDWDGGVATHMNAADGSVIFSSGTSKQTPNTTKEDAPGEDTEEE